MKTDKALIERLDKFATSLLDSLETDNNPPQEGDSAQPPVELTEKLRALDSITRYLVVRNRLEPEEEETGGISAIVSQLHGKADSDSRTPRGRTRRLSASRPQIGPGIDSVPIRDAFGPNSKFGRDIEPDTDTSGQA